MSDKNQWDGEPPGATRPRTPSPFKGEGWGEGAAREQAGPFPLTQPLPQGGEESDDPRHAPTDHVKLAAREFRYHSGRARYLMRDRDPDTLELIGDPHEGIWTDYDGDTVFGDYRIESDHESPPVLTPERLNDPMTRRRRFATFAPATELRSAVASRASYMPGSYTTTTVPPVPTTQPYESTEWYHTDQVGTTRAMTSELQGSPGAPVVSRRRVFTAFGEVVTPAVAVLPGGNRYGYCGAWGYESAGVGGAHEAGLWGDGFDPAPGLVHVGARWYEPATGRFIQRDPIGIRGGLNVYGYVDSNSVGSIDPSGLDRYIVDDGFHQGLAVDSPFGGCYIQVDFAATSWPGAGFWRTLSILLIGDLGKVTISFPTSFGNLKVARIKSSPQQDGQLIDWMIDKALNPPEYSGGYTCRRFSDEGSRVGLPPPPPPPFRMPPPGIPWW